MFFSLSGSKLPSYILPMFPALALVLGLQLTKVPTRMLALCTLPLAILSTVAFVLLLVLYDSLVARFSEASTPPAVFAAFGPWMMLAMAIIAASELAAVVFFRRGSDAARSLGVVALALGMTVAVQAGFIGYDAFRATRSAWDLLQAAADANGGPLDSRAPVYQVRTYDQTIPFSLCSPNGEVPASNNFCGCSASRHLFRE